MWLQSSDKWKQTERNKTKQNQVKTAQCCVNVRVCLMSQLANNTGPVNEVTTLHGEYRIYNCINNY